MFLARLRSSFILMIIATASLILGGELLFGVLLMISLIGMMELYRILKFNKSILAATGYAACIGYYCLVYFKWQEFFFAFGIGFLLVLMAVFVFTFPKYRVEQAAVAFFGLFYAAIMLSFIYQVRISAGGAYLVWLIFIGAWGSDTFAYLVGRSFGKHKIAPKLSPKKTLEGSVGGIIGAAALGLIFALLFKKHLTTFQNPMLAFAVIGGCSSIISQIGDLAASAIKRNYEIKDYGTLIPGHGGILDRFDSIIFTAPIVFYLAQFFHL